MQDQSVALGASSKKGLEFWHQLTDLAVISRQAQQSIMSILDEYEFIIGPLIFTFLAFFTRMYKIGLSPIVTWDEAQYVSLPLPKAREER